MSNYDDVMTGTIPQCMEFHLFDEYDSKQELRIGMFMLNYFASIAKAREIKGFTAEVMKESERMMDLFMHSGYKVETRLEAGTWLVKMYFS
jgi:hypothetical protein